MLLAVIYSLKNSSLEEVVATHDKHCQDHTNIHLSVIEPIPLCLSKQVDLSNEDDGESAPTLWLTGSKLSTSAAVRGQSLILLLPLPHRRYPYLIHEVTYGFRQEIQVQEMEQRLRRWPDNNHPRLRPIPLANTKP